MARVKRLNGGKLTAAHNGIVNRRFQAVVLSQGQSVEVHLATLSPRWCGVFLSPTRAIRKVSAGVFTEARDAEQAR